MSHPKEICCQCEANARWNDAGGYVDLAEECREYCRNGHRTEAEMEKLAAQAEPKGETT